MPDTNPAVFFEIFTEIGIIEQLSRTSLETRLPKGMIAPHFAVLNHLVRVQDGRTPIEIARAFQVPKTSMTHTLKGLEAHGLVTLRPNAEDGRSKRVWLTEAGRGLRADTIHALGADFAKLSEDFEVARLQAIRPVLRDLRIMMDAARD